MGNWVKKVAKGLTVHRYVEQCQSFREACKEDRAKFPKAHIGEKLLTANMLIVSKSTRFSIGLAFVLILSGILFVSQANAVTNYYSNNFESTSALDDGYWSLHDAEIQTIDGSNVLAVGGEATFMPQYGGYALDNFTVQFDVFHNIVYGNNSAFQGPFYEATDSEGNVVVRMGIYQRQMNNDDLQQVGGLAFCNTTTGESSHYYVSFNHASDWSTWRLTVTTALTEGRYLANVTVQINDNTITAFATGLPRPDGMGEIWVSNITNEHVLNPVAYQNLLPLPMAGVTLPTYAPTSQSAIGIHYDLMGNSQIKPVSGFSGATPSYIDNFYYGYAGTVPLSIVPTPTPIHSDDGGNEPSSTPTPTSAITPYPTINTGPEPLQTEPFPTTLAAVLILLVVAIVVSLLVYFNKNKRSSIAT